MENNKQNVNRGGRPAKEEQNRATIKLNCWVTPAEYSLLEVDYTRERAGRKLAFAHFMKQRLLSGKQTSGLRKEELLLTILIKLQHQGDQLADIANKLNSSQKASSDEQIVHQIKQELVNVQETTNQITTWLYES